MRIVLVLLVACIALPGCTRQTSQYDDPYRGRSYEDGRYDDERYHEGRHHEGGYYDNRYSGRPYFSPYGHGPGMRDGGNRDAYDKQRQRQETNCKLHWQNCATICNTLHDAGQRAICVINCNNALNQCMGAAQ